MEVLEADHPQSAGVQKLGQIFHLKETTVRNASKLNQKESHNPNKAFSGPRASSINLIPFCPKEYDVTGIYEGK